MIAIDNILHSLAGFSAYPSYRNFMKASVNPYKAQNRILMSILRSNEESDFGREGSFSRIQSIRNYQTQIPISTYEHFLPFISSQMVNGGTSLASEPVTRFTPTSGTMAGSKLIPITASLLQEFQRGIHIWMFDLYINKMLNTGKVYWSLTPEFSKRKPTPSGIPVGFEDDSDYLGWKGRIIKKSYAVPPAVKSLANIEDARYATAYFLLHQADLSFISVWNPSLFLLILDTMEKYSSFLIRDCMDGTLSLTGKVSYTAIKPYLYKSIKRARQLDNLFSMYPADKDRNIRYSALWPNLKTISCWHDASSALYAENLKKLFPGVYHQGKGLLATEGIISLPLVKARGCVPAITSHFLEFLPETGGTPKLVHELEQENIYTVIITTGGGLYRYNLKDKVKVTGFYKGLPLLTFIGRARVSDLVGEKLEEAFVLPIMERVFQMAHYPRFIMLAPELDGNSTYYTVYIESSNEYLIKDEEKCRILCRFIDDALRENCYYQHARQIGQLDDIQMFHILNGGERSYIQRCIEDGISPGNIKPSTFNCRRGWHRHFTGHFLTGERGHQ